MKVSFDKNLLWCILQLFTGCVLINIAFSYCIGVPVSDIPFVKWCLAVILIVTAVHINENINWKWISFKKESE